MSWAAFLILPEALPAHTAAYYPPSLALTMFASRTLFALSTLVVSALGATYSQTDSHQGDGFLKSFTHQAIADPTHGRV